MKSILSIHHSPWLCISKLSTVLSKLALFHGQSLCKDTFQRGSAVDVFHEGFHFCQYHSFMLKYTLMWNSWVTFAAVIPVSSSTRCCLAKSLRRTWFSLAKGYSICFWCPDVLNILFFIYLYPGIFCIVALLFSSLNGPFETFCFFPNKVLVMSGLPSFIWDQSVFPSQAMVWELRVVSSFWFSSKRRLAEVLRGLYILALSSRVYFPFWHFGKCPVSRTRGASLSYRQASLVLR